MRSVLILATLFVLALIVFAEANATKPTYSCANVRCASGTSCIETPSGPICQQQTLSCANVLCAQGNQCIETATGPQCISAPVSPPPSYYYPPRSCAYGGYYDHYGQLICYPAPAWRNPYRYGWGYYYQRPPNYTPPRPVPRPMPTPRPRIPWHPNGPEIIEPSPTPERPTMCTMQYDPVCAEKPVVCVRAPCPADRRTFGNACSAGVEGYTVLHKGVCR